MSTIIRKLASDKSGVTALEYGLIVLLVVIGVVGFVGSIGTSTCKPFATSANAIGGSP